MVLMTSLRAVEGWGFSWDSAGDSTDFCEVGCCWACRVMARKNPVATVRKILGALDMCEPFVVGCGSTVVS